MARLAEIDPAALDAEQRQAYDAIVADPRAHITGPYGVLVRRPSLALRVRELNRHVRYDTSLPAKLSELAILILARIWTSEYEWRAHKAVALKAGLDPDVVEALRVNRTPAFRSVDERVVYEFTTTLHRDRSVPQSLYDEAVGVLGEGGVIDLIGVLGCYTLISMTINVFEIADSDGGPNELR